MKGTFPTASTVAPDKPAHASLKVVEAPGTGAEQRPSASDSLPTTDTAAVGDFARHTHQYQRDYIAHADAKAGVIGTASVGLLAFLEAKGALDASDFQVSSIADWLGVASAVVFFGAALCSAGVLKPRLGIGKGPIPPGTATPAPGAIYWEEVLKHGSNSAYAAHVADLDVDAIHREIATHTYVLADINQKKYRALRLALNALIGAVCLLCGFLFLRESPAKVVSGPSTAAASSAASTGATSRPATIPAAAGQATKGTGSGAADGGIPGAGQRGGGRKSAPAPP